MVLLSASQMKMENTSQIGENSTLTLPDEHCDQVLDLSTRRSAHNPPSPYNTTSSSTSSSSSSSLSPRSMKRRHTQGLVTEVDWESMNSMTAPANRSSRTNLGEPGNDLDIGKMPLYPIESISPCSSGANDDPNDRIDTDMTQRVSRLRQPTDYPSMLTLPPLHAISPVTQPIPSQFVDIPPSLAAYPFNTAAAAAAAALGAHPLLRAFPGSSVLTDAAAVASLANLPLHRRDLAAAATAVYSPYLPTQRRRRRAPKGGQPIPDGSPLLPGEMLDSRGSRCATDDDCSGEINGRMTTTAGAAAGASVNGERCHSEEKDSAYLERRRKNNEAAKRSRDARRQKEEEIACRAAKLEQENISLRAELLLLRRESAELHNLLYGRIDAQR